MKRLAFAVLSATVLLEPAQAQQFRESPDQGSREVGQERHRYSERHSGRERRYPQGVTKVGEPNPYEPKVGAPNPYATQGGTPNRYATQGGEPARPGTGTSRR